MANKNIYHNQSNIRDMIEGELNRIAVTDDLNEILLMLGHLMGNISEYANISKERISKTYLATHPINENISL